MGLTTYIAPLTKVSSLIVPTFVGAAGMYTLFRRAYPASPLHTPEWEAAMMDSFSHKVGDFGDL